MVRGLKRLTAIVAILLLMLMTGLCFSRTAWAAMPHMIDDAGAVSASELEFLENDDNSGYFESEFEWAGNIFSRNRIVKFHNLYMETFVRFVLG